MANWKLYGKLCIIGGFIVIILGIIVTYIGGQVLLSGTSGRTFYLDVGLTYGTPFFIIGIIMMIIGLILRRKSD